MPAFAVKCRSVICDAAFEHAMRVNVPQEPVCTSIPIPVLAPGRTNCSTAEVFAAGVNVYHTSRGAVPVVLHPVNIPVVKVEPRIPDNISWLSGIVGAAAQSSFAAVAPGVVMQKSKKRSAK